MSLPSLDFYANPNLPPRDVIVGKCREAGGECRGIHLRNQPSGPIVACVKYGSNVDIAEAFTQNFVARALSANPETGVRIPRVFDAFVVSRTHWPVGYIVMDYIDAPDCEEIDSQLVAKAVQVLISVPGPNLVPGPVGGGPIIHTFFTDWTSAITYDTVEELQMHVNGILKYRGDKRRVDLVADAHDGLRLCPCDINPGNFKKCEDGTIVALDFRATCFLPPSFFAVAMAKAMRNFAWQVNRYVDYPKSDDVEAMLSASYFLVPYQSNSLGIPRALRQRKGLR
ncbi:hypothetical protein EVG20_g1605 [Dentipellis fragilis]|uniref:Aminoglycoside phosphotransferase domain-containing protein n=1 Tax=Dentipellis fragilis TaxID=205917 RepID=A0A4Y9Z961_9AGAM|nr:hypothetical protein EVG20_g1605 [Dentipellis fragilis]